MRVITVDRLCEATKCRPDRAALFADVMDLGARKWGINTPTRAALWVAQIAHESARFTRLQENLNYTTPEQLVRVWPSRFRMPAPGEEGDILHDGKRNARAYVRNPQKLANFVYASRNGNRSEASGDGYKYRGRGLKQLTFLSNYQQYQDASGVQVVENPDLLLDPHYAADSAAWFWSSRNINRHADKKDFRAITAAINGGTIGHEDGNSTGLDDRVELMESCLMVFA